MHEPWPAPGRSPAGTFIGSAPWIVLILVVAAWEALGIDTGTHRAHLTVSALAQAFRPLDAALLVVWTSVGLGYGVARARAPVGVPAAPVRTGGGPGPAPPGVAPAGVVAAHPVCPALLLPDSRAVGVVFWLAVLAAAVSVDVVARHSGGRMATSGELVRWLTMPVLANAAAVAVWMFAGYHLFAR